MGPLAVSDKCHFGKPNAFSVVPRGSAESLERPMAKRGPRAELWPAVPLHILGRSEVASRAQIVVASAKIATCHRKGSFKSHK